MKKLKGGFVSSDGTDRQRAFDRRSNANDRYDDRTAILALTFAVDGTQKGCNGSSLRTYTRNFDNKDNIKKHVPCGNAAVVQDANNGEKYYSSYAGLHALWGGQGGMQEEGKCKKKNYLDATHSSYSSMNMVRSQDSGKRAPLMLIKARIRVGRKARHHDISHCRIEGATA